MTLALDNWYVEVKEIAGLGHQLHRVPVRPVGRGGVLPEGLKLAQAAGIPGPYDAGGDPPHHIALRPVGVAEYAVAGDLINSCGNRILRGAHPVEEEDLPALDDAGNGQPVIELTLPVVGDVPVLQP